MFGKHTEVHHGIAVLEPMTITSFALSLLLVFRTNSSYDRFVEARNKWGELLNRSRDIVQQCVTFFPLSAWDDKSSFTRWTIIVSKALLCHLRANSSLKHEAAQVLCKQELQILLSCDHPVTMALQVMLLVHAISEVMLTKHIGIVSRPLTTFAYAYLGGSHLDDLQLCMSVLSSSTCMLPHASGARLV
jgi:predicted membrane chloride channel (bestrophin family)